MRDHLDDEQLSMSADRERAGVPHPTDIASHLATCDTCPERVRDTLVVIDALRRHGRVVAPRVFAVPEPTGVLLRPVVPAWASVASMAAALLLFLTVAGTARVGSPNVRAVPAPISAVSGAIASPAAASKVGAAAGGQGAGSVGTASRETSRVATPSRASTAPSDGGFAVAGSAAAPRAAAPAGGASGQQPALPPAANGAAAAPFGRAQGAAPAPPAGPTSSPAQLAGTSAGGPSAPLPQPARAPAASRAPDSQPRPTVTAAEPAIAQVPVVATPESDARAASAPASRAGRLALAPWQGLALAGGLALLIFGVSTVWLGARAHSASRPTSR